MVQHTLQGRVAKLFAVVIVVLLISLALQVAGFATPGWLIIMYPNLLDSCASFGSAESFDMKMEVGLWVSKTDYDGRCVGYHHTLDELGSAISVVMLEYQVETSIALCLLVISIVLYGCTRCESCNKPRNMKTIVYSTVVITLISGILAMAAAGKCGNEVRLVQYDLNPDKIRMLVPYSLILTGIGGIIAGMMSLVILFSVQPCKSDSVPPPSYEMSAQPAVVVYPGQHESGYVYQGQPSVPYAGQPQSGYMYQGQPSVPYAGQHESGYVYQDQPSVSYTGQPQLGYMNEGQPSVTYAGQPSQGHKY